MPENEASASSDSTEIMAKKQGDKSLAEKSQEIWYRVHPRHSFDFDAKAGEFHVVFELPGVPRENITLKVLPTMYDLRARREHTLFTATHYFPYEVDVDQVEAKYEEGLLTIKGAFKDKLADAVNIKLE
ncbi:hypothetical protein GF325_13930 [Candidatus Bathyarchaeota archaeon]|nr:hypothetical protein [Candidatus Bathyarchaeota archaeon]